MADITSQTLPFIILISKFVNNRAIYTRKNKTRLK